MGRKRTPTPSSIIQLDFFGLTDHVVGDMKPYWVPQEDGEPNPSAEILSSQVWRRQPRPLETPIPRFKPIIFAGQPGKAFCSGCGDWHDKSAFSPKKRKLIDGSVVIGVQSWCKACRNRHARRMYWLQKEGYSKAA